MDITLYQKDPQRQLAKVKVRLRMIGKRYMMVAGVFLFIGIICLVTQTPETRMKGFWTFESGIAVSAFYLTLLVVYVWIRIRGRSLAQLKREIDRMIKMNDVTEMTIDDQEIRWHNQEMSGRLKWSMFTHYKYYRNYLFLYIRGERRAPLQIDPGEMRPEEYAELKQFVRSRLLVKG